MNPQQRQNLLTRAIRDIAEGGAAAGSGQSASSVESARHQARELLPELERPQPRPGLLSQAEAIANEFFVGSGRLQPGEKLTGEMRVPVRLTDGREVLVPALRNQTVRELRNAINSTTGCGTGVGLLLSSRPLSNDTQQLYELWLRHGLGCPGSGAAVAIQVTVRNAGG